METTMQECPGCGVQLRLPAVEVARMGASVLESMPVIDALIGGVSMSALSGAAKYAPGQVPAGREFFGFMPHPRINQHLERTGQQPIDRRLPPPETGDR